MNAPKNENVIDPGKERIDQGTSASVVLQLAKRYVLEPQLLQLIQEALELPAKFHQAHRFAQISPVALLLTCIYKGQLDPQFHPDTSFLASLLSEGMVTSKDSFERLLLRALVDETQVDKTQRTPQFPDSMEAAFSFAQELANLTTKGEKATLHNSFSAIDNNAL